MSVNAILALGARIYDSPDGITYTEMTDMQEIGSPDDPEVNMVEATPVNPTQRAKEFLAGLINYGEFEWKQFYTAARLVHHRGYLFQRVYYRVVFPDVISSSGSMMQFSSYLKKAKLTALEIEKVMVIEGKAQITGPSSFTSAT